MWPYMLLHNIQFNSTTSVRNTNTHLLIHRARALNVYIRIISCAWKEVSNGLNPIIGNNILSWSCRAGQGWQLSSEQLRTINDCLTSWAVWRLHILGFLTAKPRTGSQILLKIQTTTQNPKYRNLYMQVRQAVSPRHVQPHARFQERVVLYDSLTSCA